MLLNIYLFVLVSYIQLLYDICIPHLINTMWIFLISYSYSLRDLEAISYIGIFLLINISLSII